VIIRVIRAMPIVVLTDEILKQELLSDAKVPEEEVIWVKDIGQFQEHKGADAFIDLLFQKSHTSILQQLLPGLVIINSVEETLSQTNTSFVRINAWPTFLKSSIIEASSLESEKVKKAEDSFSFFNKKIEWLPDEPGFITPRVISMIINEAFIALKEGVSTKEEIDTAMKLGTNYPYGPFEWAEKIGLRKISSLLFRLSKEYSRYQPSSLLQASV
jgi:3-hydroxybutyryl-CoA dehydrogenase